MFGVAKIFFENRGPKQVTTSQSVLYVPYTPDKRSGKKMKTTVTNDEILTHGRRAPAGCPHAGRGWGHWKSENSSIRVDVLLTMVESLVARWKTLKQ